MESANLTSVIGSTIDSIDIQLEAIHGFVYPDLVFEKIKRIPTEVTSASPMQIIAEINTEHKEKLKADRLAKCAQQRALLLHAKKEQTKKEQDKKDKTAGLM